MANLHDELRECAATRWPLYDWASADVLNGAFHLMIAPPTGPLFRVAVGTDFETRTIRETHTLRTFGMAPFPVPIPRLLDGPITSTHWSGILISRVPGGPHAATNTLRSTQQAAYDSLLSALSALDPTSLSALPPPRTWCGGAAWPELVRTELSPLLPIAARRSAQNRVAELLHAESIAHPAVCHGDFGPHNIMWDGDRGVGLIDLDHACIGDPAIDIAPLIGFHGAAAIAGLAPPELLRRAMIHRATLSLQVAAAAHLNGSTDLRDHALGNFATRDQQGTLFDPNGLAPREVSETLLRSVDNTPDSDPLSP